MTFVGAQQQQSNNKQKTETFANPTFFRDALYLFLFLPSSAPVPAKLG